jgi:hypothetical protein
MGEAVIAPQTRNRKEPPVYYAGPDRLDVFHHTASTPLAHLRYVGDRGEGWYVIRQSGCLVSVDGPFESAEEAREAGELALELRRQAAEARRRRRGT